MKRTGIFNAALCFSPFTLWLCSKASELDAAFRARNFESSPLLAFFSHFAFAICVCLFTGLALFYHRLASYSSTKWIAFGLSTFFLLFYAYYLVFFFLGGPYLFQPFFLPILSKFGYQLLLCAGLYYGCLFLFPWFQRRYPSKA